VHIKAIETSAHDFISTINSLIKLEQWTGIAQAERTYACHSIQAIELALLKKKTAALSDAITARPALLFWNCLPLHCNLLMIDMRLFLDSIQPLVVNAAQNAPSGVVAVTTLVNNPASLMAGWLDTYFSQASQPAAGLLK
jgi:hypothetical protein